MYLIQVLQWWDIQYTGTDQRCTKGWILLHKEKFLHESKKWIKRSKIKKKSDKQKIKWKLLKKEIKVNN